MVLYDDLKTIKANLDKVEKDRLYLDATKQRGEAVSGFVPPSDLPLSLSLPYTTYTKTRTSCVSNYRFSRLESVEMVSKTC